MTTVTWPAAKKQGAFFWRLPQVPQFNDQLVVKPDEFIVFYYNGWVIGVFSRPGKYTLSKKLQPKFPKLFAKLAKFREYVEVYYVAKRPLEAKFGTKQPLMFEDKRFDIVQIRAFGTYTIRVHDPVKFVQNMIGRYGCSASDEADVKIKDRMVTLLNTTLGKLKERGLSVIKIPGNMRKIEAAMLKLSKREFSSFGLVITAIVGLNINLPPEVQKAINEMSAVAAVSDKTIDKMTKYETMRAIRDGGAVGNVNIAVDQIGDKYEIGQVGNNYSTSSTVIQDSVVQRSTVGAGEKLSCPSCNGDIQEGWKMCPLCGSKLEQKCPNCGGDLQDGWRLCPNCGFQL